MTIMSANGARTTKMAPPTGAQATGAPASGAHEPAGFLDHEGLPSPRRFIAVFSVSLGSILLTMDPGMVGVALPNVARSLGVAPSASVLLVVVYNLVLAMTLMPFAALGDRMGLRRLYGIGLVVYAAAASLCFFASDLRMLLALRALEAIGAGAALSVSIAMVRTIYPASQLGRGMGFNTVAAASGAAVAPALGGLVLSFASWRWVFIAGVPLAIISLATVFALPDPERRDHPFDGLGGLLCAATFGLVIGGLEALSRAHVPAVAAGLLLAGAVAGTAFVRHELTEHRPVLPVDLLARPAIGLSILAAFMAVLGSTTLLLALPFGLQAYGFSPAAVGAVIAPYAVATTIFAPAFGMLSDRVSPALLGTVGLVIAGGGLLSLAFIPAHPHQIDIAWRTALCGAGFGMFFSPNGRLVVGSAPRHRAAAASSLVGTTRMIAQASGSTLLGALLAAGLGGSAATALVATGLTALAFICSAARFRFPARRVPSEI
jgi:DHA2 family multidrug resistance protein-like MFS transporter